MRFTLELQFFNSLGPKTVCVQCTIKFPPLAESQMGAGGGPNLNFLLTLYY
jgi:hypothetical protein